MNRKPLYLVLSFWTLWSIVAVFFLEHVLSFEGLGFDGAMYGKMVIGFPDILIDREMNAYYIFRILPSAIIWLGLKVLHIEISSENIINGFYILNYLSVSCLLITLFRIVRLKQLSDFAYYFICMLLIMNTGVLKFTYFIPVLTDSFAMCIGGLMLYASLTRNLWGLCVAIFLGIFTWPISVYSGLLLVAAGVKGDKSFSPRIVKLLEDGYRTGVIAVAIVCLVAGLFILKQMYPNTTDPIQMHLLFLSVPILLTYVYFILKLPLTEAMNKFSYSNKSIVQFLAIAFGFGVMIWGWKHTFADLSLYSINAVSNIYLSFLRGVHRPAVFLVGHISYWGPLTLFIIVFWDILSKRFSTMELPVILVIVLHLFLAVNSESRFLAMSVPFLLYWILPAVESLCNKWRLFALYACTGVIFSKIWLPINPGLTPANWQEKAYRFFISFGPWMQDYYYLVQLIASAIAIAILYGLKKYFVRNAPEQA